MKRCKLLININNFNKIKGRKIRVDNAPYLNENNGLKFKDMNEFIKNFQYIHKNIKKYDTRNWLINNLSDEVTSKKLFDKFKSIGWNYILIKVIFCLYFSEI